MKINSRKYTIYLGIRARLGSVPFFFFCNSVMAATAPNTFILSNIHHLVPTKLNGGNYILWKSLFEPILRAHSLLGFIDGTNPCPSKFLPQSDGSSCTTPNTKYLEWIQQDQHLITWINSTLSETVLPYVVGLSTSKSIWDALSKRYSSLSLVLMSSN